MIGTPGRVVIEKDFFRQIPQTGGPGGAIAAAVADNQVGRQPRGVAE